MLRLDGGIDLRVLELEHDLLLAFFVDLLLEAVDGLADLDGPQLGSRGLHDWLDGRISGLPCRASRQVGLMLFALRVREVAALVGVQGQAQAALVCSDVVPHEVRVLGDVDGLEGELPQPLLSFHVRVLVAGNSNAADPSAWPVLPVHHLIRESK